MNMQHAEYQELLRLLGELCSERIDDAGWTRLEFFLHNSPQARLIYRRYLNLHIGLKQCHVAVAGEFAPSSRSPILGNFLGERIQQVIDFCWHPTPFALLVAVFFLLACLFVRGLHVVRHEMDTDLMRSVATLSRALDCDWGPESRQPVTGEQLEAGRRLNLRRGLAELAFNNGTAVILEGPVTLDIKSERQVELASGKLVATVPKQAAGFYVQTSDALIVDLGTQFGVIAGGDGPSETEVFQGRVEVSIPVAGRKELSPGIPGGFMPKVVEAGQTVRVDARTQTVIVALADPAANRFIRQMPVSKRASFQDGVDGYSGTRATFVRNCVRGSGVKGACVGVAKSEPDNTNRNYGGDRRLFTAKKIGRDGFLPERSRVLIAFDDIFGDLSGQIPQGAKIISATLRLHTVNENNSEAPEIHTLHEVLVGWEEGTATWRNFNGGGRPDRQYRAGCVDQFIPDRRDTFYELNVTESLRRWSQGASNHGWVIVNQGWDRAHFDSDDADAAANRPLLVVEYKY